MQEDLPRFPSFSEESFKDYEVILHLRIPNPPKKGRERGHSWRTHYGPLSMTTLNMPFLSHYDCACGGFGSVWIEFISSLFLKMKLSSEMLTDAALPESLTWGSPIKQGGLVSNPQSSTCFCLPALSWQTPATTMAFYMGLGIQLRSSGLSRKLITNWAVSPIIQLISEKQQQQKKPESENKKFPRKSKKSHTQFEH